ncbi:MAG: tubulin-like doman-containing protein, partial [Clostridia bacterium]
MLSRNYASVKATILNKLLTLVPVNAGAEALPTSRISVVIVTGICGGTGSGTFLDVAQIVRECLRSNASLNNKRSCITGYLVMPDISCSHVNDGGDAMQSIMKRNGYAALKELDFWMRVNEHKTPYTMQYTPNDSISWDMPPFDTCVLMSGITVNGAVYNDGYQVMRNAIAENLLHCYADEPAPVGAAKYTYFDYDDNLKAIVPNTAKKYPMLLNAYRAVGAYTKRIPKQPILYYEGQMLLKTFIPPLDGYNKLVPSLQLMTDGNTSTRATKILGDIRTAYNNLCPRITLPALCGSMPDEQLLNMKPKPHERVDFAQPGAKRWKTDVIIPAMLAESQAYLNDAWQRFEDMAEGFLTDPALGPFSLKAYLESDADCALLPALRTLLQGWVTLQGSVQNNLQNKHTACENTWAAFVKPPLLGKAKAMEAYRTALKSCYDNERSLVFFDAYIQAAHKLIKRVKDYLSSVLIPMCEDLLRYQSLFVAPTAAGDALLESDVYHLDTVKGKLDETFSRQNADDKYSKQFLGALCNAGKKTIPNVDPQSSGITFLYERERENIFLLSLKTALNNCFGAINNQSLDTIMLQQTEPDDLTAQNAYMDSIGNSVIASALPMFSQDPAFTAESVAMYSYLSIPEDAARFVARYSTGVLNTANHKITPKPSGIKDHLYCMTSWDGLPLYRYSMMNDLEKEYEKDLYNPEVNMGMHLVWDAKQNSNYTTNWSKLPDPKPYYFFAQNASVDRMQAFQNIRELTNRALLCGLLAIPNVEASPKPSFELHFHYTDGNRTTFKAASTIRQEIDAIQAEKNPATGKPYASKVVSAKLQAYLANAATIVLQPNTSPTIMAANAGLIHSPCNPFDPATAADPEALEQAK